MIVDVLSNANSYKGLSPLLDRALDALGTVLFSQDAHKPGCHPGSAARVRKLVLKVGA